MESSCNKRGRFRIAVVEQGEGVGITRLSWGRTRVFFLNESLSVSAPDGELTK